MSEPERLEKAELRELDAKMERQINQGKWVKVQFNPETLKVSFANQIVQPQNPGDQRGSQARQFVGAGTTKLSLQLWFDVTALPAGQETDVRKLTSRVAYFITPTKASAGRGGGGGGGGGGQQQPQYYPPAVRFVWGTFQFDGMMDSLEESLEFWSSEGRPLRASLSLALSQQKITFSFNEDAAQAASAGPAAGATPGTRPLAQAPAGATLPGLAAASGSGGSWQSIAAANGIEDPLRLAPGQLIDLNARLPLGGA